MSNSIDKIQMEPLGHVKKRDVELKIKNASNYNQSQNIIGDKARLNVCICAFEVEKIGSQSRGFLNEVFDGREQQLRKWVEQFAPPCFQAVQDFVNSAFTTFQDDVLIKSLHLESTNPIVSEVLARDIERCLLGEIFVEKPDGASAFIEKEKTCLLSSLFTTNTQDMTTTSDSDAERSTNTSFSL